MLKVLLVIIVILVVAVLYFQVSSMKSNKVKACTHSIIQDKLEENNTGNAIVLSKTDNNIDLLLSGERKAITEVDRKVNYDDMQQPIKRYPTNYYPQPPITYVTNIPTRGPPDSFSYLGNLHREYDNKFMKLYGRQRYTDFWDYYAIFNTPDNLTTKVNIESRQNKELYNGDEVEVSLFGKQPFKVFLHKADEFGYSPYII